MQLVNGEGRAAVLRSWWIVSEALAAIGNNESELSALAQLARRTVEPPVRDSVAALKKKHDDAEAFASVLYASLAMHDKEFTAKVLPLLTTSTGKDDALLTLRTIAKALLDGAEQTDTAALAKVVSDGVAGEDLTLLLAMACKRTSDEAWDTFRGASRELIGEQPLDGNLVVLVNRLAMGRLPLIARR